MTLPAGPPISFSQIAAELGVADASLNISQANARNLAGVASGPIGIRDFYGKSATFTANIGGDQGAEGAPSSHSFSLTAGVGGGAAPYSFAWSVLFVGGSGVYTWGSTTAQNTSITLSPNTASAPYQVTVQCVVTDSLGHTAASNSVTLTYTSP